MLRRVYRKPVLERVIKEVVSKGYAFQMEIVMRAKSYGYKIEEVSKLVKQNFKEMLGPYCVCR